MSMEQHHIAGYLEHATILMLTFQQEQCGIIPLETGLFRLPVMASALGGVAEINDEESNELRVTTDKRKS